MTIKASTSIAFTVIIAALFVLAACTVPGPLGPGTTTTTGTYDDARVFTPDQKLEAKAFTSVADLESFLQENQGSSYYGGWAGSTIEMDMVAEEMAMDAAVPAPTANKAQGGSDDYSETNVQVQGVDEGDIIKTDGEYIYTVSGSTLFIVKAYPGDEAAVEHRLSFGKGQPQGLFVKDDRLVVFGRLTDYGLFDELGITSRTSMTYVEVYDVSDKDDPELEEEFLFEGNYFESRMIDDHVYVVTQSYPEYGPRPMPLFVDGDVVKEVPISSIRYFPYPYDSVSFVTINAIDLDSGDHSSETLAVEASRELYMSHNNIYLAYTKHINEWELQRRIMIDLVVPELSEADQELVEKIKLTDNDVLSRAEKEQKIFSIIERYTNYLSPDEADELEERMEAALEEELAKYDYFEYTVINKVAVDGLDIEPVANGKVPGYVNNQFSLDEYDGVLRVATTVNARWSSVKDSRTESENFVFTLDEDLEILDSLDGIAPGESIYSTRYMGERLYMVTFRQVDPFFVIDLSNPKDIEPLGELKIPGFSRYLHPYDEDTIIGIGRDATVSGRTQGLKISLFDVSDVASPEEVASWVSTQQYSQSTAEYEHKAFLFSKEKGLLVIPAYSYDWRYGEDRGYNGALVFDISKDDINVRGLIDHSKGAQRSWGQAVERSLYIDDFLYTKSYGLLRINSLDDLESVKDVELDQKVEGDIPVY
ncbi:beta-propeller domain-containing protein [Candidatus Woesearchaeota archaeon]|nr:beta-propeller domain-containing protein [Candidatus Woesearchaeota archaeon]